MVKTSPENKHTTYSVEKGFFGVFYGRKRGTLFFLFLYTMNT